MDDRVIIDELQRRLAAAEAVLREGEKRQTAEHARTEQALRESEMRLAEELDATRLLQRFSTALIPAQEPESIYDELMDAMMGLMQSESASIQTYDDVSDTLKLVAYRGYAAESAEYWSSINAGSKTVCGKALRANHRVVIPDVETVEELADTRDLQEYCRCGLRGMQSTPLHARDGRPLGMISTCWREPHDPGDDDLRRFDVLARMTADLLERAGAEAALRESEARLRTALSMKTVGVISWDDDFRLMDVNEAFLRMTSFTRPEALGKSWQELTPPEFHSASHAAVAELETRGEITPYEKQYFRKDGSRFWGLFAMRKMNGGAVEFVLDITAQKATEHALRESEARFRQFADASSGVLWIRSADTLRFEYVSPAFEAIYGDNFERVFDGNSLRHWAKLILPEDRKTVLDNFRRVRQGKRIGHEFRIRRPRDGAIRWIRDTDFPLLNEQGRVQYIAGIGEDITPAKQAELSLHELNADLERRVAERTGELIAAEASLRQVQKMDAVGQLASGIAHDFNNMLQGIGGSLELMRRRSEQGRLAEASRHIDSARDTVRRAAALTHRLLAFSRQQTLASAPVNLDELVTGMTEMIQRTVGATVQVEVRLGGGSWPVLCDASQLENALLNLCLNARDAMPDGGWLTILTAEIEISAADLIGEADLAPGVYVAVSVTDTGTGMTEDVMTRVFEPFYTTKPIGQGTGLGLSQVYGFVRQSGGLMRIDSAPGQGTTIRLILPRYSTPDDAQVSDTASAVVLLVEDEESLRSIAAEWLRDAGYRVLEASDGAAALRLLHGGGHVDILVTDVGLPGMNGRQVAETARAERPTLPVLFITGYANMTLRTALPDGMAIIDKPFALDELVTRVRDMLEAATQ